MRKLISIIVLITVMLQAAYVSSSAVAEQTALGLSQLSEGDIYDIVAGSRAEETLSELKSMSLKASDVPKYLDSDFLKELGAVKRLKNREEDLSSVVYRNDDGQISEIFFAQNVKYINSEGVSADKTNILYHDTSKKIYTNLDNDIRAEFPEVLGGGSAVKLKHTEYTVSMQPQSIVKSQGVLQEESVLYSGVFGSGTALCYSARFSGIKEDILLYEKPAVNTFVFDLALGNLRVKASGDVYYIADAETDEIVGDLGELIIYDNDGNVGDGEVSVVSNARGPTEYRITVNEDFLQTAVYPVVVDPAVVFYSETSIYDTDIKQNDTAVNPVAETARIGYTRTGNMARLLVKLPGAYGRAVRCGASRLSSVKYYMYSLPMYTTAQTLRACRMTSDWNINATTLPTSLYSAYTNQASSVLSVAANCSPQYFSIELKNIFLAWLNGAPNYGIMIRSTVEQTGLFFNTSTMNNTQTGIRPYSVVQYTETLPTVENANVRGNYQYLIKAFHNQQKLITRSYVNNYHSLSLSNAMSEVGATTNKSQFVDVNYLGQGKYSIAFLIKPADNAYEATYKYLSVNNQGYVYFTNDCTNDYSQWHILFHSVTLASTLINAKYNTSALSYVSNGLTYIPSPVTKTDWYMVRAGISMDLFKQQTNNYCGPTSASMVLNAFGLNVTQHEIVAEILARSGNRSGNRYEVLDELRLSINSFLGDADIDIEYLYKHRSEYTKAEFLAIIRSNLYSDIPILASICKTASGGSLPYITPGHYVVVKGYYQAPDGTPMLLINDPYDASGASMEHCNEYLVTYDDFYSYCYARYVCMVYT